MTKTYNFNQLQPSKDHILSCSYSEWYPRLAKYAHKTHIIKNVPSSFRNYILQDGIKMPSDFYKNDQLDNSDYSDWEESDKITREEAHRLRIAKRKEQDPTNDFKELHQELTRIIRENGPVLPKTNWSAPKDAAWILPNHEMKCSSASDVYLILNSSSYIVHDLTKSFDECIDLTESEKKEIYNKISFDLVLKEWKELNPAWEFRVFVKDREIVAVSQRDSNYYDYLQGMEENIKDRIFDFFKDIILQEIYQNEFVFDVYLPEKTHAVELIDINPFTHTTDPLLYSWNEIVTMKHELDDFELRLVNEYSTARFAAKEHSENYVPKDFIDAAMDTEKMIELMKTQINEDSSDDDDDGE